MRCIWRGRSSRTLNTRQAAAGRRRHSGGSGLRPARDLRHRQRRHAQAVRGARGHRAARGRLALRRVQGALRDDAGDRVRAAPRLPGRHRREQRRALLGIGAEGDALHRAVQPARRAARLPAEHHRLHGRAAVRARRDREGRRQDGARGRELGRAEVHGRDRRLVRRRQLRHVRPRLRAAAALDVAQRADLGDGRRAGGRRADDGQARPAGARSGKTLERRRTKPRSASRSWRSTSAKARRTTRRRACGTTGSSIPRRRVRRSRSACRRRSTRRFRTRSSESSGCRSAERADGCITKTTKITKTQKNSYVWSS